MIKPTLEVFPTPQKVAAAAAALIIKSAKLTPFRLVLSGGSTPKMLFALLASPLYRAQINWVGVEIYFADERTVPPDHPDSNYRLAHELLLSRVPIPAVNINRMRGEIPPKEAAIEYGELLQKQFADDGPDLILLGMGPDGHTASLFPHTAALNEAHRHCVANYVEKLKTWRITMTAPFINRASAVCAMIAGADKAERVHEVLNGPYDPKRLPIQLIEPASGNYTWMVDSAAAPG
jgi:6-phosphogluconolactonase